MKLVRFGKPAAEKPGLIDADGQLRDLSAIVADIGPAQLSPQGLAQLAALDPASLPVVTGQPRLGVPFTGATKFLAIGLNYTDHAAETGMAEPKEPIIFQKTLSCMVGAYDDVMLPRGAVKGDWEIEIGIVIGTRARYVSRADALAHVAGYTVVNDVSERAYQLERGGTWDKGKGCDTFGPIGPWLVSADEVGNPQALNMWLEVNGERKQTGTTANMIFDCATLVSYCSEFMTLNPGDIIATGTPAGVGMGMKPPQFLKPGDIISLGIERLGEQRQRVLAFAL